MALITCPDCGGKMSTSATVCVHCGYKWSKGPVHLPSPEEIQRNKEHHERLIKKSAFNSFLGNLLFAIGGILVIISYFQPWAEIYMPMKAKTQFLSYSILIGGCIFAIFGILGLIKKTVFSLLLFLSVFFLTGIVLYILLDHGLNRLISEGGTFLIAGTIIIFLGFLRIVYLGKVK